MLESTKTETEERARRLARELEEGLASREQSDSEGQIRLRLELDLLEKAKSAAVLEKTSLAAELEKN